MIEDDFCPAKWNVIYWARVFVYQSAAWQFDWQHCLNPPPPQKNSSTPTVLWTKLINWPTIPVALYTHVVWLRFSVYGNAQWQGDIPPAAGINVFQTNLYLASLKANRLHSSKPATWREELTSSGLHPVKLMGHKLCPFNFKVTHINLIDVCNAMNTAALLTSYDIL